MNATPAPSPITTRRNFLKRSALLAGATSLVSLPLERSAWAAGSDVLRVGLIGCGGRGSGAALNAMNAGPDIHVTALADLFQERVDPCLSQLRQAKPDQARIDADHCFVGFDAYQRLLQSGVDVVLITPASHFIPVMLRDAVAAGKHVFCEKPHGIDIPGLNIAQAACAQAEQKKLSVVSGLCWRYDTGVRETMQRIHDGAIGDIVAIQENYVSSPYIVRPRRPGQSEMEFQLWNWYHFNWLSGDQTAQQLVHSLDKASWALGDVPPVRAWGMGGRQTCLDPQFGDQFDHHAVVFEYANGVRVYGFTRDQEDCYRDTSDFIIGTKGRCDLLKFKIEGAVHWQFEGKRESMYDLEHRALFDSIRQGRALNNGHYMCLSSALGIVAQIACYSGAMISWDQAMQSRRSFALPRYDWDVPPPVQPGPDGRYPSALQGQAELDRWQIS